ncbi:Large exoproteins involved in heme utilization or adhesion [Anaerovibrio sp. JC8]|uniref:hypothetical protein n=1 Tax=Anaerovibrio sp. JC8 TaxID=1240085 RepID=UPI000A0B4FBF|nr:hypothetical protein [Anaerovibrio sp. JC8]ORU01119.1 Large exoproteins involved in heme utilization or adhesion [Anaerovibrio sp. JC8]
MKSKQSKQELTRLIMAALILGGGCLYGPVAEVDAQELEVDINMYPANYSSWPDLKKNGLILDDSNKKLYLKSNTDTLKFNTTDTRWASYNIFGVYRSGGDATGYTVTLETGPSDHHYALGTLIGGNTDSGKAYSNHVYMKGGRALYVYGGNSQHGEVSLKNVYDNTVNITGGEVTQEVYGGRSSKGDANDNSVTIGASTGSITIGHHVFGGLAGGNTNGYDGSAINNTVTVGNNTTISGTVYGGYSHENSVYIATSAKEASSNTVTINGGVLNHIVGGYGVNGNAKNNTVTISNGIINGDIIGAFSDLNTYYNKVKITAGSLNGDNTKISGAIGAKMSYNSVSIGGGDFKSQSYSIGGVYNGNYTASEITHNSLNLYGTTKGLDKATLAGGYSEHNTGSVSTTDNNIYIGGSRVYANDATSATLQDETPWVGKDSSDIIKNTVIMVKNVDNLVLRKVNWSTTTPALNVTTGVYFNSGGGFDISGMSFANTTSNGTMTLFSNGLNTLNGQKLIYNKLTGSGTTSGTLSTTAIKVKNGTSTTAGIGSTGVSVTYEQGSHNVKLDSTQKKVLYTIGDSAVNTVTLGSMTWGTGASGTGYTYDSNTAINASNLTFTGSFNSNPINQTTNLLSNANGIKDSTTAKAINLAASFQDANGIGYSGAATNGNVISSNTNKNIIYKVTGATLDSLNLAGWNGSTSTLLSGWSKKNGGISVSGVFTKPTLAPGASKDIMTTDTADFFSDATISDDIKYKAGDSFSDTVAGVTLAGNKAGGVKATNSGKNLTFYGEKNDVSSISLGSMTWGTPRAATAAYDFSGVTNIDASGLAFTGTATLNSLDDSTNLLTGATGLTSDTITQPTNKTFDITYTDNNTKITYKGQATNGSLTRDNTNLKYTISAGKVNEIDLGQWNGTGGVGNLPTGWSTPTGGVEVDTGDFESPTGTDNVDIFTTTEDGFFNENNITGDKKYKDNAPMPDDKKDGVTISGTKSGGIAPSEDGLTPTTSGKRLTYFAESTTGSKIALGEVAWTKDGTARALTGNYNFSNLVNNDVDATNLKFTFTDAVGKSVNTIAAHDTMTLLSGATGLASDLSVNGSPHSQSVSYSLTNGAGLSGTLTGDVTTSAGAVNYTVTSKTLDSVNLNGWDGATNENLDVSWTKNANGIKVTGNGFTAPTTIGDTPILTTNVAGYFSNAQIADNIKYQPSGSYTETEKNVTLSGTRGLGIKADDNNGSKLVYSIGAAYINNLKLGTVDYTKDGTWLDKSDTARYDFSNLSSLDTAGFVMSMTDDQKKTAVKNDNMTLLKGNATLNDIAAKDTGDKNYTYKATEGLTVGGTISGSVSASGNNVLYTIKDNTASTLDVTNVAWGTAYNRDAAELNYSSAVVDSSNVFFTGVSNLSTGDVMTLVTNYGSGINKTRGGIFTLENGKTGKGTAYYEGGVLKYKVTLGAGEVQPAVSATNNKAILVVPDGQEHQGTVIGGEAKGDGDSTGNEQGVKGKIITNTDGTGGDVNGGTSEEGDSKKNKADVEDSTIAGDVNGGKSDNGNATDNEADVDHSNVGGDVNGGSTNGDGETKGNEANVKNGSKVTGNVTGGRSGGNGDSTGNAAEVEGSEVGGDVNGGQSDGDGNTKENKTHVKDSKVTGNVNGGHSGKNDGSGGNGESTGNTAEVDGSEVGGDVNGGRSEQGNANQNESTVSGGSKVTGDVTGGTSGGGGTANENKTTVSGSTVGGNVIGGQSDKGDTDKNETTVTTGSKVEKDVIGGKNKGSGTSNENKTTVDGSTVGGSVTGGQSESGSTDKNETKVSGKSKVTGDVTGGQNNGSGTSSENKTTVEGGSEIGGSVVGGQSASGNTDKNEATVTGGSKVDKDVIGGQNKGSGTSSENKATVDGSTVGGSVTGGQSESGSTDKNEATVTGGSKVEKDVIGGQTKGNGTSNENKATVTGSEIGGNVMGGQSENGNTNKNEVNVTEGSTVNGSVSGGKTTGTGSADNNAVNIASSIIKGSLSGGDSTGGSASGNTVTVNDATIGTETTDGNIYGGKTLGDNKPADTNTVNLTGGTVNGGVFGGYSENGSAANNSVTVNGTTIRDYIYGGKSKYLSQNDEVYFKNGSVWGIIGGGCEESLNNLAELADGTVEEHVIGGFATGTDGVAKGNKVQMTGGTVKGSVIGGYGNGTAENNTVYLGGGTVQGTDTDSAILGVGEIKGGVYGGYGTGSTRNNSLYLFGIADVSGTGLIGGTSEATGNVLNIGYNGTPWTGGDQLVKNIKNFEALEFSVVPWSKSKSAITVTDGTNSDLSMTTVGAKNVVFTGVKSVSKDDTMTLIDQTKVTNKATKVNEDSSFTVGNVVEGTGKVALDGSGNVVYNVKSVRATEQTHNTLMGAEATMTTLNVGNDYIGSAVDGLALP